MPFIIFSRDYIYLERTHRCPNSPTAFLMSWQKSVFLEDIKMAIVQANSKTYPQIFSPLQIYPYTLWCWKLCEQVWEEHKFLWTYQDPSQITGAPSMISQGHLDSDLFFPPRCSHFFQDYSTQHLSFVFFYI